MFVFLTFTWVQNTKKTLSKVRNQVQRSKTNTNKFATRYNGTEGPENKLPKKKKPTHCLKIVRVCNLLVAIISVTGKVTPQLLVMSPRN